MKRVVSTISIRTLQAERTSTKQSFSRLHTTQQCNCSTIRTIHQELCSDQNLLCSNHMRSSLSSHFQVANPRLKTKSELFQCCSGQTSWPIWSRLKPLIMLSFISDYLIDGNSRLIRLMKRNAKSYSQSETSLVMLAREFPVELEEQSVQCHSIISIRTQLKSYRQLSIRRMRMVTNYHSRLMLITYS